MAQGSSRSISTAFLAWVLVTWVLGAGSPPAAEAGGLIADVFTQPVPAGAADAQEQAYGQITAGLPPLRPLGPVREAKGQTSRFGFERWLGAERRAAARDRLQGIPPAVRRNLEGFVSAEVLDRVRWSVGTPGKPSAGRYGDAAAMTLIDAVVFFDEADALHNPGMWAHALGHVAQFERWGVRDFAARYLRDPQAVEREAEDYARRWAAWAALQAARQAPAEPGSAPDQIKTGQIKTGESEIGAYRVALARPVAAVSERAGNVCSTALGSCLLDRTAPAAAPCWCGSPFGAATGAVLPVEREVAPSSRTCVMALDSCEMEGELPQGSGCACTSPLGTFPGLVRSAPPADPKLRYAQCVTPAGACGYDFRGDAAPSAGQACDCWIGGKSVRGRIQ